jgi:hypothetical protein
VRNSAGQLELFPISEAGKPRAHRGCGHFAAATPASKETTKFHRLHSLMLLRASRQVRIRVFDCSVSGANGRVTAKAARNTCAVRSRRLHPNRQMFEEGVEFLSNPLKASRSRTRPSTTRSRPRCLIAAISPWCRRRSAIRSDVAVLYELDFRMMPSGGRNAAVAGEEPRVEHLCQGNVSSVVSREVVP